MTSGKIRELRQKTQSNQEAKMEFSTKLVEAISGLFKEAVLEIIEQQPDSKVGDLEQGLRRLLQQVGGKALSDALSAMDQKYPAPEEACGCGYKADYQFRRQAKTLTVFGWVEYRRAYYLCTRCHQGQYPLDQRFGLQPGQVSAGLAPLLALAGVETAFEEGCELVKRFLLLEVSDNTLRKETQTFGQLQAKTEQAWQAQSQDPQCLQKRQQSAVERPRRLYGSLDGTHVPIGEEWRELKTGSWYEVEKVRHASGSGVGQLDELRARHISYYCDIAEAQAFEALLWASAVQRNADLAAEIVFVADGAPWIWNLVERNFPQAVQIVDWYHAVEYLAPLAEAVFGSENRSGKDWLETVRTDLWEGHLDQVIAACRAFEKHARAGEAARRAVTYYTNNAKRMDYARFRAAGYQIGSGTIESGCKQIATQRLKRSGARWTVEGARMTAKARAAWLSGHWDRLSGQRAALPLVS
jgi:hypothetical protein